MLGHFLTRVMPRALPRVAALAVAGSLPVTALRAQYQTNALARVAQQQDAAIPAEVVVPGCTDERTVTTPHQAVGASFSCRLQNGPGGTAVVTGGTGTAAASAGSSFDPTAGTLRSQSQLSLNGFQFSPFAPTYDANGARVYSGVTRPDGLAVESVVAVTDRVRLQTSPNAATMSMFFQLDGSIVGTGRTATGTMTGAVSAELCLFLAPDCFDTSYRGFYNGALSAYSDGDPGTGVAITYGQGASGNLSPVRYERIGLAPANESPFSGDLLLDGTLAFYNIPIAGLSSFSMLLRLGTIAEFYRDDAYGLPCDPADPSCANRLPPEQVVGDMAAQFGSTMRLTGYQLFDVDGNDVTTSDQLLFDSGLTAPPGSPLATVAAPEPTVLLLVGPGLVAIVGVTTRRARAARRAADRVRRRA